MPDGEDLPTETRVRYRLSSYYGVVLAACLVVAALGGVAAYQAHAGPDTTTEERVVGEWTAEGEFDHRATAQRDAVAFEEGEVLRNRSLYFTSVTPVLNGTYNYTHAGDVPPANVTIDLRLVLRAVDATEEETTEYWRVEEPLASTERRVASRATLPVSFSVDVTDLANRTARVDRELEASVGRTQVLVVAETRAETTLADEPVVDKRTDRLSIRPRRNTYEVSTDRQSPLEQTAREAVTVPVDPDPLRAWGGLLLALVGLAGAGGFAALERRDQLTVSPAVRAAVERREERAEFDEWVSRGRVPPASDERVVELDSLADLVDVAIDSDRRVIEDDDGPFVVLDGDTRYVYDPGDPDHAAEPESAAEPDDGDATDAVSASDVASGASLGTDEADRADADADQDEATDPADAGTATDLDGSPVDPAVHPIPSLDPRLTAAAGDVPSPVVASTDSGQNGGGEDGDPEFDVLAADLRALEADLAATTKRADDAPTGSENGASGEESADGAPDDADAASGVNGETREEGDASESDPAGDGIDATGDGTDGETGDEAGSADAERDGGDPAAE
ncbi:DUF5305 domain-containing protein [Halomicrobium urmianum]|uniref:DUF5305 domain-containing protein n=1 Tax=Halomicrobium urmianum TaxID=1586233 RepID=UPI001CD96ECB|nr:DUF5305 domain-containing protein [Halomicrobium urmianum]